MNLLVRTINKELALGEKIEGFKKLQDTILTFSKGQKIEIDSEEKLIEIQKNIKEWVTPIEEFRCTGFSYEYVELRYNGTPWLIPFTSLNIVFTSPFKEENGENERKRIVRNVETLLKYNRFSLEQIAGFMQLDKLEVIQQLTYTNKNVDELSAQIAKAIWCDVRYFVFPSFQIGEAASVVDDMIRRKATENTIKEIESHSDILNGLNELKENRRRVEELKKQLAEASEATSKSKENVVKLIAAKIM